MPNNKRKVQMLVTVEVSSDAELERAKQVFAGYYFSGEGLIRVGEKLSRNDLVYTTATKDFIKKMT